MEWNVAKIIVKIINSNIKFSNGYYPFAQLIEMSVLMYYSKLANRNRHFVTKCLFERGGRGLKAIKKGGKIFKGWGAIAKLK